MKEVKEKKENTVKIRMSNSDIKNLKKISKQSKMNSYSEVIRTLIESKVKELNKQKNIFE
jgi:predicted DNA binding CopG/RHH family protein